MWILVATVCMNLDASSCDTLAWIKEGFISEEKCAEAAIANAPALSEVYGFQSVKTRCVFIPTPPNV